MSSTHTPTPWFSDKGAVWDSQDLLRRLLIAECIGDSRANAKADAAFIVRAVNVHDDLVAALREIANGADGPIEARCEMRKIASAALAKAEEGAK
jgi:hypothetical protein